MKGRKWTRFFMMVEDERRFLQHVLQTPEVVLLSALSSEPEVRAIPEPLDQLSMRTQLTALLIWKRSFAISQAAVRRIMLKEYSEALPGYRETGVVQYYLESAEAPVIAYRPSFLDTEGRLVSGSLSADMYCLQDQQLVHKGAEFESWYDSVASWVRHNLKRVRGLPGYIGVEALAWHRQGGELRER